MHYKWIGAVLIVSGCAAVGYALAAIHRYQEKTLGELLRILDFMVCELHFRMTPLPQLCRSASVEFSGVTAQVMLALAEELEKLESDDVSGCMDNALLRFPDLPDKVLENLRLLGNSLGRFDLEGQISGLEAVRSAVRRDLDTLTCDRELNLRGYQTLGLCAGAALAIVLL